jgi:hypothetical protein
MSVAATSIWGRTQLFERNRADVTLVVAGMRIRLILLALPVLLVVLSLVACGGKGGGGY